MGVDRNLFFFASLMTLPISISDVPGSDFLDPPTRLEASLAEKEAIPRPNSRAAADVFRHSNPEDVGVNEFDFDFDLTAPAYPLASSDVLPDTLAAVQYHTYSKNALNFASYTNVGCFCADQSGEAWLNLTDGTLKEMVKNHTNTEPPGKDTVPHPTLLVFFVSLVPQPDSSFGNMASITRENVHDLFSGFGIAPSFIMNMLGRPDYWAPVTRFSSTLNQNALTSCEYSCQHPRFNLQFQGSPVALYMKYDRRRNHTVYIISHKQSDSSILALYKLLGLGISASRVAPADTKQGRRNRMFLDDPFYLHLMVSMLSFEAAKYHVARFRRVMWEQTNAVDDHLAGLATSDRERLGVLTKELQVISQNADSLIAGVEVAIITAKGIKDAHRKLHKALKSPKTVLEGVSSNVNYIVASFQKQKMWLLNYRSRKDSTMSLVFNLVTQQDAANNINIAVDMRRDSASMNAIAMLTMLFLPGTFTATVLSAGIFSFATSGSDNDPMAIRINKLWWFWLASTLPLTAVVMLGWWAYHKLTMRSMFMHNKAK